MGKDITEDERTISKVAEEVERTEAGSEAVFGCYISTANSDDETEYDASGEETE